VDRALDVIAGIDTEGGYDPNPFWERQRALFLVVVEPATFFEFASQSLDGSRLVAVADDVSEGEVERRTVLIEMCDLANTADTIERRWILHDRCDLAVQL
jgi:hypothetical protein